MEHIGAQRSSILGTEFSAASDRSCLRVELFAHCILWNDDNVSVEKIISACQWSSRSSKGGRLHLQSRRNDSEGKHRLSQWVMWRCLVSRCKLFAGSSSEADWLIRNGGALPGCMALKIDLCIIRYICELIMSLFLFSVIASTKMI